MLGGVITYGTKFRNKPFKQGFPDTACDVLGSTREFHKDAYLHDSILAGILNGICVLAWS